MRKSLLFALLLTFVTDTYCQLSNVIPNSLSVANASVSDNSRWSAFVNPASLASVGNLSFGMQYENRYFLKELSIKSLTFALPSKLVTTGISASYFGFAHYNEILVGIGFARDFESKFAMGVQFNYQAAYFKPTNRYYGALFPDVGLTVRISPEFVLGFRTFNPFQTAIKTETSTKQIASIFSIGTTYAVSDNVLIRFETNKEISSNYRLALGIEYKIFNFLTLKGGAYDMEYLVPCMGIETNFGKFRFHLNSELHPLLGLVNSSSLSFAF